MVFSNQSKNLLLSLSCYFLVLYSSLSLENFYCVRSCYYKPFVEDILNVLTQKKTDFAQI